ncbi:MAG: hypothetical protein JNK74_18960 [Candidatus Hydrogenedentes bacterium]|nr:hypothetical protein [Candidatus Hydrogenedentota bacterium]
MRFVYQKNLIQWLLPIFFLTLTQTAISVALDVEESVGLAVSGIGWRQNGRIEREMLDPGAKAFIKSTYDSADARTHVSMIGVFGMLADSEEDVQFVEKRLISSAKSVAAAGKEGALNGARYAAEYLTFYEAMGALNVMVGNDVPGAREVIRQMNDLKYWTERDLVWETYIDGLPYEGLFIAARIMQRLNPNETGELPRFIQSKLLGAGILITDAQLLKLNGLKNDYASYLGELDEELVPMDSERKIYLRRRANQFRERGTGEDEKQTQTADSADVSRTDRYSVPEILDFHGRLTVELTSPDLAPDLATKERFREISVKAENAFLQIRENILDRKYKAFASEHFLLMGKPFPGEVVRSWDIDSEAYAKAVERIFEPQREVLEALGDKLAFGTPSVGEIDSGDNDILVVVSLADSRAIAEERIPQYEDLMKARHFTFSENGDLLVVMRSIDGMWYWNPFGR